MEAPDKIYLPVVTSILTKQQDLHHEWQYSPLSFADENIEYIRKDLLLEWAKELTSEPYDRTTESARKHQIAHYLLEKYNSL